MKILLIKLSSMGDVIHTFPALTDAARAHPDLRVDWVVESGFQELPALHPTVNQVIPVALRQWRQQPQQYWQQRHIQTFIKKLRQERYDLIIDAQGLVKSALIAMLAKGHVAGLNRRCAREPLASLCYRHRFFIDPTQPAAQRTRALFAKALQYPIPNEPPDCAINQTQLPQIALTENSPYLVFIVGTTWPTKHWPEPYWRELLAYSAEFKQKIYLTWGNADQHQQVKRLSQTIPNAQALPALSLTEKASLLAKANAVVSVDTGLGHLAAAVGTPTIMLFGPTKGSKLSLPVANQFNLQADFPCAPCEKRHCSYPQPQLPNPPCFTKIKPQRVYQTLKNSIDNNDCDPKT